MNQITRSMFLYMCKIGDMESAIEIQESYPVDYAQGFRLSCMNGHLELVKWLWDFIPNKVIERYLVGSVCRNNHIEVMKWLMSKNYTHIEGFMKSCEYGHFELAVLLYQPSHNGFILSCGGGNLELVKWLYEKEAPEFGQKGFRKACINGHLDIVEWISSVYSIMFDERLMVSTVSKNHLPVCEWLYENNYPVLEGSVTAAHKAGTLETIKWVHAHYSGEKEIIMLIDFGHVYQDPSIVKWLCNEYNTRFILYRAFSVMRHHEDLEMVQWLYSKLDTNPLVRRRGDCIDQWWADVTMINYMHEIWSKSKITADDLKSTWEKIKWQAGGLAMHLLLSKHTGKQVDSYIRDWESYIR